MGSGQAGRRVAARLLAVCAVLFGLFLMHGAPATAATGCHGVMPAMSSPMPGGHDAMPAMPSPMPGGHEAAAAATAHASDSGQTRVAVRAPNASRMPGALCVSTPAHERIPLPAPGLFAVAAVTAPAVWMPAGLRAAGGGTRRRGPPAGGRDLLRQVCIART
ncbi:hypothetical protein [Streptomyces chiangmaiensis]|uniref:Uncharacterized protein n=1 Tax=Streptomyces chiangmaiensis TaxID=766497 RepID=A0ABU7FI26_9ACTN|nr:hypothetical protein [Streptomyces chiangmaiensis]MED7823570.1 hypothetical protein [Streptomyces chiangmaiensis]